MLVGVFSDTHDDMARLKRAVSFFNEKQVAQVIHAGDIISPFTFEVLRDLACPFTGIFGNNDGDRLLLREKSNGNIHVQPLFLSLGDRKIAVIHEPTALPALAQSGLYDIVIYGHTHIPEVTKVGKTLVINPGKTATLHKGTSTVALLDTDTMEAEILTL